MTDFTRARQIFLAACHLPSAERPAFLDRECGDNAGLRADVESLLEHDLPPEDAPVAAGEPTLARPGEPSAGEQIGRYRIIHEIGRGGIGIVYAAVREDDQFKRRIALKVLKRGMDTEDILRRFDLERQLLAALNHPNIARLYDGGRTEDGRPYFVMEFVDGRPIDHYCDTHRLRIGERLRLFQAVCSAVHHAHQNLVVHRDLKPANILVTEKGVPKLLDFGIAKLINPDLSLLAGPPTSPELRIMTPEYASPEQVRGTPITTASDIYSLGVLLYEIVSGHRPYRFKSRMKAEIERVICDEDPERPSTAVTRIEEVGPDNGTGVAPSTVTPESVSRSRVGRPATLQRQLRGDIDNIVLMAMRKEPQRRYQSAEQFAEDIGRHLRGMPVIARQDTVGYRFVKFVRRNRAGVAAAGLFVAALAVAVVISTWGWRDAAIARRETTEVIASLMRSAALRPALLDEIRRLDNNTGVRHQLAEDYLQVAEEVIRYDRSTDSMLALVEAHLELGDSLSGTREGGLGRSREAEEQYREGLRIAQALHDDDPEHDAVRVALAMSHLRIGDVLNDQADLDGALESYGTALELLETIPRVDASSRRRLAVALLDVGKMYQQLGRFEESIECYTRSLQLRRDLRRDDPSDLRAYREESRDFVRLAFRRQEIGEVEEALVDFRSALDLDREAAAVEEELGLLESWARRHRGLSHMYVGDALRLLGRTDEALEHLVEARLIMEDRLQRNQSNVAARRDLAVVLNALAAAELAAGEIEAARSSSELAVRILGALVEEEPRSAKYRKVRSESRLELAGILLSSHRSDPAISEYRKAEQELAAPLGTSPDSTDLAELLARSRLGLGRAHRAAGHAVEAGDNLERARRGYRELYDTLSFQATIAEGLATTCRELAGLATARGDHEVARALNERALDVVRDDPSPQGAALRRDLNDDLAKARAGD